MSVVTRDHNRSRRRVHGIDYALVSSPRSTRWNNYAVFPCATLAHFVRSERPDVINAVAGLDYFSYFASALQLVLRRPVIYTALTVFSRTLPMPRIAGAIGVTHEVHASLRHPRACHIPSPVPLALFRQARGRRSHTSFRRVGTMGSPVPRRGIPVFARTCEILAEHHKELKFCWAYDPLAARIDPEAEDIVAELLKFQHRLPLRGRFVIDGAVNVSEYLASLDVFVYCVQTVEGMIDIPPTVLEALAVGVPTIVSACGSIERELQGCPNLWLVDHGDRAKPEAYVAAVERALNTEWDATVMPITDKILDRYDAEVVAQRFESYCEQTIEDFHGRT